MSGVVRFTLTILLYNLIFDPLAGSTGPFLARLSVFTSLAIATCGFNGYSTIIAKLSARRLIFITCSGFYRAFKRNPRDMHTINSIEQDFYAKKRKTPNLAYTEQSLKAAASIIATHIDCWVDLLCDGTKHWKSRRCAALCECPHLQR
jgi:hypothetical protein